MAWCMSTAIEMLAEATMEEARQEERSQEGKIMGEATRQEAEEVKRQETRRAPGGGLRPSCGGAAREARGPPRAGGRVLDRVRRRKHRRAPLSLTRGTHREQYVDTTSKFCTPLGTGRCFWVGTPLARAWAFWRVTTVLDEMWWGLGKVIGGSGHRGVVARSACSSGRTSCCRS